MAKNIVFCADGTWNGDSKDPADITCPTNVLKIFHNLGGVDSIEQMRLADEQERVLSVPGGSVQQIAKYLHGVGDSSNWLVKLLGGSIGAGLISRVIRGYTFISRNYVSGDQIFLVGFSRGSYTVRALAGLIASKGLLDASKLNLADDHESAYKLGSAVWYSYRHQRLQDNPRLLGKLEELGTLLPAFFSGTVVADDELVSPITINTVAVFDTVGALGIPVFDDEGNDIDSLRFVDTHLSRQVEHSFHAISLDEQRANFPPTFFDPDQDNPGRIVQVLFPGAHSDVGGGYPESGLSDGALEWMTGSLRSRGVKFQSTAAYVPQPDALGPSHQPWRHGVWAKFPTEIRVDNTDMIAGLMVHDSIEARRGVVSVVLDPVGPTKGQYLPTNLGCYLDSERRALPGTIYVPPPVAIDASIAGP